MREDLKRIILAYLKDKSAANYVEPLRQDMPNYPYYNEQEETYTDLTQMDTTHGGPDVNKNDKMFVYPEKTWNNVDWGQGNFLSPYDEQIFHKTLWNTPNDAPTLWDPQMTSPEVHGLNNRNSASIDSFLNSGSSDYIKIASMDLTDFMKVSNDTLVHKSRKDLWKMYKDADGNIYIKRLFDGELLKDEE